MQNLWPTKYFQNPNIDKPIEQIWDEIDAYSFEKQFEDKPDKIDFVIPFIPLKRGSKVIKGVFYSQGVDMIIEKFPRLKEIFFPIANSMFGSYPHSKHADLYFGCYENKKREEYFKNTNPLKQDKIILPLQDADFVNEYKLAPTFNTPKDTDILSVATAYPVKNLPILAKAIIAYKNRYRVSLKSKFVLGLKDLIVNPDGTLDTSKLRKDARKELDKVVEILGDEIKNTKFYPFINHSELPKHYTSARVCVLTSLLEGKNRFISESLSCNTPIIVFKNFNKYLRGDYPIFFENSGEYVPKFSPESLAETIHKVLFNRSNYNPRENYLNHYGRKNFVNKIIDSIPYYKQNLPNYEPNRIFDNVWVDVAMQKNYQLSTYDFVYGRNPAIQHVRGMKNIESLIRFFYSRFGIEE